MDRRYRFEALPTGRFHDLIVSCDLVDPGLLGWIIRLPEGRRQLIYAILTKVGAEFLRPVRQRQEPSYPSPDQISALRPALNDMRELRARNLIEKYFGSCPDGYLGALRKTEGGPQGGLYYRRLYTVFTDPAHKNIAKVVRQLPSMDAGRLSILLALDPTFLSPRFCSKVRDAQQAADLSAALVMIRQIIGDEGSDKALEASIRCISESTSVSQWVAGWLARAKHMAYPQINLGPDWTALDTGEKLTEVGLRLQVCLKDTDRIVEVLKGQKFYFENTRRSVIAEVQAIGPQRFLILAGVHGRRNVPVPRRMRREVEGEFLAAGVSSLTAWPEDCPWRAVERIPSGFFDVGIGDHITLEELEDEVA